MKMQENLLDKGLQAHSQEHTHSPTNLFKKKRLDLVPKDFPGGIAIWGALPAVFNSSAMIDEDDGVHVHARMTIGGPKQIDETFDIVRIHIDSAESSSVYFDIDGTATANYNISTILKKNLKYLLCPSCNKVHTDIGILAVTYHTLHHCEHCGTAFLDKEPGISNSVMLLKEVCGDVLQDRIVIDPVDRRLNVKRKTFRGGMQMWGSNPAVLWTSPKFEEGGIHFHGFQKNSDLPTVDETFGTLIIDGLLLDPEMMRHLMVQKAMPFLTKYLDALVCPNCETDHFDTFDDAVNPHLIHTCEHCNCSFYAHSQEPCVSNPLIRTLKSFAV
ncbi:hypothetical protein AAFN85_18360 [Mucilaginibacter sp. CAU 1740]|uniref:hypothetical protein n=1 Tax=Mucilaginibacter sp. CAU 1740 TaxID=3140365 RepID=UPI00325AD5F3